MANLQNQATSTPKQDIKMAKDVQEFSKLQESVTIRRDLAEVFNFWRNFENFPLFMKEITSVQVTGERSSHWIVDLPRGPKVEWDAQVVEERFQESITWQSLENADVRQFGTVSFMPATGGRGTVVNLSLRYELFGGPIAELATKLLLEDPKTMIQSNLRRVKAYLETGEIPTVEGQPSGRDDESETLETRTDIH